MKAEIVLDLKGAGDEFKWTFRKNAEGNYVFEGLERVR
jgi:hypothetical protein